ncbi:MAG: tRNA 2-thiocytidine(32) synthetase TtcA [Bdellovibrionaceae bacterium]|nr:tRNA 2-thiocytidine(32) synthetase TtcA [Pseudobdellovibrionaceae bacterium]
MTPTPLVDRNHPLAVKIRKQMTQAMAEFNMISDGDKLMLCVSGGKDSSIMTILFEEIRKRSERKFTFEVVILDQKQPGFNAEEYKAWLANEGLQLTILEKDTYSVVTEKIKDGVYCSLCSKMRRAILYDYAFDKKFSKMALGHHRDDVMETTLLNLFYVGQLSTMPPKLKSDDDRNTIIRPMVFVAEKDLIELSQIWNFPVIPCNLCGSQEGLKRKKMKKLIQELEKDIPHIGASFSNALQNAKPSHLMDHKLYNFKDI